MARPTGSAPQLLGRDKVSVSVERMGWQSSPFTTRNDNLKSGRRSSDFRHFTPLAMPITPASGQVQQISGMPPREPRLGLRLILLEYETATARTGG